MVINNVTSPQHYWYSPVSDWSTDVDANCTNGDIRLVNGASQYQGRVEVCLHGNWGTVCDDSWDNRDATVVCNQLGYTEGMCKNILAEKKLGNFQQIDVVDSASS